MDIKLRIPDEVCDEYLRRAGGGRDEALAHVELGALLVAQLIKFRAVGPHDRAVVVSGEDRQFLETILGPGHLLSSADLRRKVEQLARLSIGEIQIDFTQGQWQELRHRASKLGISPEVECRRVVEKMSELFFQYV